ncbi:MAG: tRNA (N6-isopentenyl adenosine(37)-C2)-methylthiotransferase MiaB [Candidatus Gracilibacteria bacterium]|nr:tRNA (N6-isopentenyl adenosine(37)-C2)-methylthiotransferase MiaB [Candidatus Gracilibacteria bacterium]
MKFFFIQTFGCQQNYSDSERIKSILEEYNYKQIKNIKEADIIIFNTCSVRQKSEDKAIGYILNAHRLRDKKPRLIGLTGCMARKTSTKFSQDKDSLLKKNGLLDFVFRIEDTPSLPNLLKGQDISSSCIGENTENLFQIKPSPMSVNGFVPIMTGCNKFCSYCIVPYTRGREKSRPIQNILNDCKFLVDRGISEIMLLGQNVNAYYINDQDRKNRKNQTDFAYLLDQVAQIKGIKRIRYTSPHPSQMSLDVIDVMSKHENICNHIHLPVQSGSSEILKKMNRSHTREDFEKITAYARKKIPNIAISTDLIVGFPSETEDQFKESKALCEQEKFDMIYAAQFSPRKGTTAYKMPDNVPQKEKKRRFHEIQEILKKSALEKNQRFLGKITEVLIETIEDGLCTGKNQEFKQVHFKSNKKIGEYAKIKIDEVNQWFLKGEEV